MAFAVIGLGSMGKRRVRDLLTLTGKKVIGWDLRADRRREAEMKFGIDTYESLEEMLEEKLDAIIISTPPDKHMPYAHLAADLQVPFFTEASVPTDGMQELVEKLRKNPGLVAAPSCTMRFHPAVSLIQQLVAKKTVGEQSFFSYHSGQYLPDWHPYEDYRTFYVSKRDTGGCREIVPFEWMWLTSIFGPIQMGYAMKQKVSKLDADIDDVYQMIMKFEDGTQGHVTVDVVSRIPTRLFTLIGERGTLTWNFFSSEIEVFHGDSKQTTRYEVRSDDRPFQYEDMYLNEMRAFLGAISGEKPFPHDYEQDLALLVQLKSLEEQT